MTPFLAPFPLADEMVHAVVGLEHGHRAEFERCARSIGLEGQMATATAGEACNRRVNHGSDCSDPSEDLSLMARDHSYGLPKILERICPLLSVPNLSPHLFFCRSASSLRPRFSQQSRVVQSVARDCQFFAKTTLDARFVRVNGLSRR
jgi:hypothetical protein